MGSVHISSSDIVLGLVHHVFPDVSASSIEDSMSSLTLEDESKISGTNTISTFLATKGDRIGSTNIEKAEVQQWLSVSAKEINEEALVELNTYLAQQTFLVSNSWTICDLIYYARIHPIVSTWDEKTQCIYCHTTRWFDHIQHLPEVESFGKLAKINTTKKFDKSVTVAIKKGAPKESIAKDATKANPDQPATASTTVSPLPQKQAKKEKKAKEPKAAAAEPELSPSMISFKVGVIQKAILHPDADSLYVSTVDLGESEPRTVVSGLVKYIPLDDMQGRRVVCVCNLKPAAMRGIKSSAMVLAASPLVEEGAAKDMVELVQPPESCAPGDVLQFKGFEGTPEAQLNPKKKLFEQIQVGFTTTDALQVVYKDIKDGSDKTGALVDSQGNVCQVKSIVGASIR